MTPKTFVLNVDHTKADGPQTLYALDLARLCGAYVRAYVLSAEFTIPPMVMADIPVSVLDAHRETTGNDARATASAFHEAAEKAGIEHSVEVISSGADGIVSEFADRARSADLVVLGQHNPDRQEALTTALIEAALFSSGRPVLIVPYIGGSAAAFAKHPVIAWNGTATAARAVHDAVPLFVSADEVEIVAVDHGIDQEQAVESGTELAKTLERRGINARFHVIPSSGIDAANALLSHISDAGADMLVMGGYGHSRFRELILGGATREILNSMTVPVLMAH